MRPGTIPLQTPQPSLPFSPTSILILISLLTASPNCNCCCCCCTMCHVTGSFGLLNLKKNIRSLVHSSIHNFFITMRNLLFDRYHAHTCETVTFIINKTLKKLCFNCEYKLTSYFEDQNLLIFGE